MKASSRKAQKSRNEDVTILEGYCCEQFEAGTSKIFP